MSALSFKINAETDKLNSFIASLKRLKEVLADIPSGTKEFDVINRKIAEMEARVEQTMKRIAQMQNEAAKTVSQPTAALPAAPSSVGSASGAQAVNAETAAWYDLLEELGLVAEAQEGNIRRLKILESENVKLKKAIENINKAEQDGIRLSERQHVLRTKYTLDLQRNKVAISEHRSELANQIKFERAAIGSMDGMSQSLARMRTVYRSLGEGERGSAFGQNLLKNIQTLDTKIKELDASIGNHQHNVGNYASSWNGLSFSIQQVAREIPSFTYGIQTGFMAISNNMPILFDEIIRARKAVEALKKAGESYVPVWRQIARSIISWQTLLVAGITVLTLYGKEIAEWVGSLFKGEKAVDAARVAAEQFHATMAEGSIAAQSDITKLNLLYKAATDLSKPYRERAEAVKKLQDIYPAYFGNMSAEQVMVGNAVGAYESLRDAIIEVAKAQAAQNQLTGIFSDESLIQQATSYKDYAEAFKKYAEAYQVMSEKREAYHQSDINNEEAKKAAMDAEAQFKEANKAMQEIKDRLFKEIKTFKGGDDLIERIEKDFNGNIARFFRQNEEIKKRLGTAAEKLYTSSTWQELNAEAEEARRKAEQDA